MKNTVYQVHITLKGVKPMIWRRLLIPSDMLLPDFHKVIQTSMGWTNSHLHHFIKGKAYYAEQMEEDEDFGAMNTKDYQEVQVSHLLKKENDKMVYEYDFGDGWEHTITLEQILPLQPEVTIPSCLAGKRNCPPEDIGGPPGYADVMKILSNPKHPEYEEYEGYEPEYFDLDEINECLADENYGCIEW